MSKYDYEIIEGKPHQGLWFGTHILFNINDVFCGDKDKNPLYQSCLNRLLNYKNNSQFKDLEIRHETIIERPPYYCDPFSLNGSLGVKFMVWGRAFKVMRFLAKKVKRYKKSYVNGKRKLRRIKGVK